MLYGIPGTNDPATAYAAAITYWVFSCRDKKRSRASGLDKWSRLQTCIQNAAIPAQTIDQYIAQLAERLTVPTLIPSRFSKMLANPENQRSIWIGDRDGNELQQLTPDNNRGVFISPQELLRDLIVQGITERQILTRCKPVRFGGVPHVIEMYCQGAEQIYGFQPVEAEESIAVEATEPDLHDPVSPEAPVTLPTTTRKGKARLPKATSQSSLLPGLD